jgi:class 3 adenylate cyclase/protein-S-isoprenylcysteine O-methyltransferase Ste14
MEDQHSRRKLAAILAADVAGYSRLMSHDEEGTIRRLQDHLGELVEPHITAHQGRIVKRTGDGLLVDFASAIEAVRCAVAIQAGMADRNRTVPESRRIEFRIGINVGDIIIEGEDIYGDGVNLAARLEGIAEPGAIFVSRAVRDSVRDKLEVVLEDLGEVPVKNIARPVRVFRIARAEGARSEPLPPPVPDKPSIAVLPFARAGPNPSPIPVASRRTRPIADLRNTLIRPAAWAFYVVLVFEILFMISPAGLFFYSVYGPVLGFLNGAPATAWLTQFFLPHIAATGNLVLDHTHVAGGLLIVLGLIVFLAGAVPLYWSKIRRRGAVTGGIYRLVRHPQYVGLAVMGLGTLLLWPRFLVLVAFVTMLFLYRLLAGWEEAQCLARFGDSYRAYRERTGMFLPHLDSVRLPRLLPAGGAARVVAGLALFAVVMVAAVAAGFGVREYAVSRLSAIWHPETAIVALAPMSRDELTAAYELAAAAPGVRSRLDAAAGSRLVYVIPEEWFVPDLPVDPPTATSRAPHGSSDFDRSRLKVLFARPRSHTAETRGAAIVTSAYGLDPLAVARLDMAAGWVTAVDDPPHHVRWGDIPTPLF